MRRAVLTILIIAAAFTMCSCAAILEDETLSVSEHSGAPHIREPQNQAEASNYTELKAAVLELVAERLETGTIYLYGYDGDAVRDTSLVCNEVKNDEPLGAYAVSEITAESTKIVSYYEVEVSISFKRTKKQIDSIINVPTVRFLRMELLSILGEYTDEAALYMPIRGVTDDDIIVQIKDVYYMNPRSIVIMPGVAVEAFPDTDGERIIELRFGNIEPASILRLYGTKLTDTVSLIAGSVGGDNDGAILLELAGRLASSCVYDEGAAVTMSGHGAQSFAATAYGALVNNSAVGEGFAMAYKALCDELGFECEVVLGYYDGVIHAWNIVLLDGEYYHIDTAMCAVQGMESAFLMNDLTLPESYTWDKSKTVKCQGELTYNDIASPEPA